MGDEAVVARIQQAGIAYGDQAAAFLTKNLGRAPMLDEIAIFYAMAAGGMQGAMVGLLQSMNVGIEQSRQWLADVAQLTQEIATSKNAGVQIRQDITVTPIAAAPPAAAAQPDAAPTADAPPPGATETPPPSPADVPAGPCSCLNKRGMCVVCYEALVGRLTKAAGWVTQVQGLGGTFTAECADCTSRLLDRAVAATMMKTIRQVDPLLQPMVLSAVMSALPQITGLDEWPETVRTANELCPAAKESSPV